LRLMANPDHLARLREGVESWNSWRETDVVTPDFSGADLSGVDLSGASLGGASFFEADLACAKLNEAELTATNLARADLRDADFTGANLIRAFVIEADLDGAKLSGAKLSGANLTGTRLSDATLNGANLSHASLKNASLIEADLSGANLTGTNLSGANLTRANLTRANLSGANLDCVTLVRTELKGADLTGCFVYGLSAWDVGLEGTIQSDLIITPSGTPTITVDNLEIAQFIYLLLNNKKIRHVIDTITSKVVLILGRFTPERKAILDAIRNELRKRDYTPVLFDFEKPANRDITETVSTLAHMARFVIADITDAKSIPQELMAIVPTLPSVPVQPLLLASQREYGMFEHFKRFPWVLEPYLYEDQDGLLATITDKVIGPAEAKAKEQTGR
jgi:uncharacterized protein YjbI with pentapeptide repeats